MNNLNPKPILERHVDEHVDAEDGATGHRSAAVGKMADAPQSRSALFTCSVYMCVFILLYAVRLSLRLY